MRPDVNALFDRFNEEFFDGKISKIPVVLNGRLQTVAGKCWGVYTMRPDTHNPNPFLRDRKIRWLKPTRLELHVRLFDEIGWDYTRDGWLFPESELTLLHEMTHAYLWEHMNDKGHGRRFQGKMTQITAMDANHTHHYMDVSRWRRMRGVRRERRESSKVNLQGSFNPFAL